MNKCGRDPVLNVVLGIGSTVGGGFPVLAGKRSFRNGSGRPPHGRCILDRAAALFIFHAVVYPGAQPITERF